jgi:D-serine deaminase-like pyridoxal phosphate-dependent protein
MRLKDLQTPALILDRSKLNHNMDKMAALMKSHGVALRPHLKTAKCATIAHMAMDKGAIGITVSTLSEAEYFFENGVNNILYAVCITANKLDRIKALTQKGADIKIILDTATMANIVCDYCDRHNTPFKVMVEVDTGGNRTGVSAQSDDLITIATLLHNNKFTTLVGVMTHAGHSYHCKTKKEIIPIAEEEYSLTLIAGDRIKEALGLEAIETSLGSTPTAMMAKTLKGITEVRAGVYVFSDLFQAGLEIQDQDDIAISVLSTVISRNTERNMAVIDAGGLALSKDRSTASSPEDKGYGLLCYENGDAMTPEVIITGVHQEHGELKLKTPLPNDNLHVGQLVRVLPNHACMTAAPYDTYYIVEGDSDEVIDQWGKLITNW